MSQKMFIYSGACNVAGVELDREKLPEMVPLWSAVSPGIPMLPMAVGGPTVGKTTLLTRLQDLAQRGITKAFGIVDSDQLVETFTPEWFSKSLWRHEAQEPRLQPLYEAFRVRIAMEAGSAMRVWNVQAMNACIFLTNMWGTAYVNAFGRAYAPSGNFCEYKQLWRAARGGGKPPDPESWIKWKAPVAYWRDDPLEMAELSRSRGDAGGGIPNALAKTWRKGAEKWLSESVDRVVWLKRGSHLADYVAIVDGRLELFLEPVTGAAIDAKPATGAGKRPAPRAQSDS